MNCGKTTDSRDPPRQRPSGTLMRGALWCVLVGMFIVDEDDGIVKIFIYSFA